MTGLFGRSWSLAKETFGILSKDKEMLLFPILSGIVTLLVMISFVIPLFMGGILTGSSNEPVMYALLFIFYFVSYFVVIFFNAGLIKCATIRLEGGDPTFRDGISASISHIGKILAWSLVSATVGLILRLISDRSDALGDLVAALIGGVWSLATFFVIPVMIIEDKGVGDGIKGSWNLFKQTWGETMVGNASLFVVILPPFLVLLVALGVLFTGLEQLFIPLLILFLLLLVICAVLYAALQGIFVAVMYNYAKTNAIPAGFNREVLESAFVQKQKRA